MALQVGDRGSLSYGEWHARADAAARALAGLGIRPGDRVALAFPDERLLDYAATYLGVLRAGAVAVPLGTRFAGREREVVLDHAGVAAVLEARPAGGEAGGPPPAFDTRPDDLAEIIYTSGTTGRPKGVACSHANLIAHDVPGGETGPAGPVSFAHAFPIGTQAAQEALRVPLRIPGRVAIALPRFDPEALCALVAREGVTRLQLVPAMAQLLVASGAARRHDVSSVRRVILSSAPAPPALFARLAEAFPRARLWNAYALTEAGAARTMTEWDPARPDAVGRPVGATEVRIAEDGEIWLRRRDTPARTYYRDPQATAEVFVDGWVRTGDLGFLDGDGVLHLTGRKKDLIITGGANVSPVEVEHVLYEHPAVVEAAVVGVPHPVLGEEVAAAVVVRAPTTARELQDLVRSRLAEHKVPHRVVLADHLPHNASGKVVKPALRARLGAAPPPPAVAPRDETEAVVASVWEAVLDRHPVGVDDDFFELGGHSLAAAQIAARLQEALGVEVPVTAVFESPTVADLARRLRPPTNL